MHRRGNHYRQPVASNKTCAGNRTWQAGLVWAQRHNDAAHLVPQAHEARALQWAARGGSTHGRQAMRRLGRNGTQQATLSTQVRLGLDS